MFTLGIFAGVMVVGFAFAKLRARANSRPSVTRLMPR
jgi:hypothetical protein